MTGSFGPSDEYLWCCAQETARFTIQAREQPVDGNPICPFDCHSQGECMAPGSCNCSSGWAGDTCEVGHSSALCKLPAGLYSYTPLSQFVARSPVLSLSFCALDRAAVTMVTGRLHRASSCACNPFGKLQSC